MRKKHSINTFTFNNDKLATLVINFIINSSASISLIVRQKTKLFSTYILFIIIFINFNTLQAQVQNDGELYISGSSVFYDGSNGFNFGLGSTTTSRNKLDYGVLSFSNGVSWDGANDMNFVDGYVETQSNTAFILPIGQAGIYAPIQVIPSNFEGVGAAYFRSSLNSIGSVLEESISSISSVEYWDIIGNGVKAGISLSWRSSSAISDLTSSSLPNLTIVGWNGSAWVSIPSTVDEYSIQGEISSLISGSISSNVEVDLSAYSAFSFGATTNQLLVPKFDKVELMVYINNNRLYIDATLPITAINIYDIMGKKIFSEHLNGDLKYNLLFNHSDEIYIAKIELDNGASTITKKIINKNYN
ncbi:hypothetical protein [Flavobacterium cellulosilyticum]|uniref:T9SS type A sorting domain-containing protein n=1 Tax=Flavobacterium cellulosilyticum TaxID=2541731 RepID=A0A4R5CAQ0_9FLAO|nr:hypothetical protein [Flavobacterium cellulosilyticum]TDD95899.1 hypothetical protein E0F76_12370 [Flavobacterium cellulosilyticum]